MITRVIRLIEIVYRIFEYSFVIKIICSFTFRIFVLASVLALIISLLEYHLRFVSLSITVSCIELLNQQKTAILQKDGPVCQMKFNVSKCIASDLLH